MTQKHDHPRMNQDFSKGAQNLHSGNMSLCLVIQTLICSSSVLRLRLRPAEIGGTGPPLSYISGDAVNQNAGWQPGPDPASEGDPRRQSGHHHHWRQRLCVLSHPQEGQFSSINLSSSQLHIRARYEALSSTHSNNFLKRTHLGNTDYWLLSAKWHVM